MKEEKINPFGSNSPPLAANDLTRVGFGIPRLAAGFFIIVKANLPLFLILAFLLPTLFFGYTSDDRQWIISAQFDHNFDLINLWDKLLFAMQSMDRFFPISIALLVSAFHFFDYSNSWAYHLIIIIFNIAAFLLFIKWADEFFKLPAKLWLILLLLGATQFRLTYNDPIVSNFGMLQVLAIFFFLGLIFLNRFFIGKKKIFLFWWGVLVSLQLMDYELAFFMLTVSTYLIFKNRFENKKDSKIALVFLLVIILIYLIIYFSISQKTFGIYSGTSINLNAFNIFKAFVIEASGSLPLIYGAYLATVKLNISPWLGWGGYAIFLVVFFILISAPFYSLKQLFLKNKEMLIYGLLIWFSASVSIAFSSRYQNELVLGHSYAVGYIQNFGFALIIYSLANLKSAISKFSISLVVALTFIMNSLVIYEGVKVDNAKIVMLKTISNQEIVGKYKFDYTIFNEKIFQSDTFFKKYFSANFGNPLFFNVADMAKGNFPIDGNIGLAFASLDVYRNSYAIIGRFNKLTFCLEDGYLISPSFSRSQELAKQYPSGPIMTYHQNSEVLYGFHINEPILIPGKLVGSFR